MVKVLKWTGVVLAGFVALVILAFAGLYWSAQGRLNKTYTIPPEELAIPTDAASIEEGKRQFIIHCATCHGENAAGSIIFQDPALGTIVAPNISAGRGAGGGALSDAEMIRAIRHGVGADNKALLTMPSDAFYYLNDRDLGNLTAYLKHSSPVENSLPKTAVTPLAAALIGAGAFGKVISAEEIDKTGPRPPAVAAGVTVEYGDYLVRTGQCRTCHGADLTGGKDPDPNAPRAPSLTRSGELGAWSQQDFSTAMRTGVTPGGRKLSEYMPWKFFGQMSDDELKAVWLYLQSLPVGSTGK